MLEYALKQERYYVNDDLCLKLLIKNTVTAYYLKRCMLLHSLFFPANTEL